MKKIKRILYIMIVISLTVCSVPFSVEAASTVPVIISPVMYEEVVPYTNLTIRWTAPTSGTVSYYVLDIYKMAQSKYGQDYIYMNSEYAYENSFLFPAIALDYGEGYRISLRAVMSDDTVRYADEVHFFSGVSKGIASGNTISLRIYSGFEYETKEAIYYSTRAWINATGMEKVNTYSYSVVPSKSTYTIDYDNPSNDDLNDDENVVMPYWFGTEGPVMLCRNSVSSQSLYTTKTDILINKSHPWSNNLTSNTFDVRNVMTHEIGHAWGLTDKYRSYAREWTMYGAGGYCETIARTLHSADITAINQLYY
ncbi:MAG: matrixin family metalloprotease [Clostridia bacterium]|nr:matrixin family metalloprotease [Clostridia bacterium]